MSLFNSIYSTSSAHTVDTKSFTMLKKQATHEQRAAKIVLARAIHRFHSMCRHPQFQEPATALIHKPPGDPESLLT